MQPLKEDSDDPKDSNNPETRVNYEDGGSSLTLVYWIAGFLLLIVALYMLGGN